SHSSRRDPREELSFRRRPSQKPAGNHDFQVNHLTCFSGCFVENWWAVGDGFRRSLKHLFLGFVGARSDGSHGRIGSPTYLAMARQKPQLMVFFDPKKPQITVVLNGDFS